MQYQEPPREGISVAVDLVLPVSHRVSPQTSLLPTSDVGLGEPVHLSLPLLAHQQVQIHSEIFSKITQQPYSKIHLWWSGTRKKSLGKILIVDHEFNSILGKHHWYL